MRGAWDSSHAPARVWRAGAWSLQLRDDELADIAYDGVVLLRAVRAVVRDRNWDTATTLVDAVTETDTGLALHVRSAGFGSSFTGAVRVAATGPELIVECDLRSVHDFETNRTGLVVLHPPSLAGTDLEVTTSSGRERSEFPRTISPHQPVLDIAGLAWQQAGLHVQLALDGDVFEMEDQRNWTDASFKTYSRPLAAPFPYAVSAGEHVHQTLRLAVKGIRTQPSGPPAVQRIDLHASGVPFPRIGTSASTAPDPEPAGTGTAGPLLLELDLATINWRAALDRAARRGSELDIRFVLDDAHPHALHEAVKALRGLRVIRVTAFQAAGDARHVSDRAAIDALRAALEEAGVDTAVVGGARSHFTQLNREHHRLPDDLAGIVFSITPLFHSLSTEQLVESIPMQRLVAEQAIVLAAGAPVHIGPVTLRPHLNDVATTPPPMPENDDLRAGYGVHLIAADDPRQSTPELAAWTVASAAALAIPGVATLSYFEEWGPRGIHSLEGSDLPVARAVEALRRLEGGELLTGESPDGLLWAVGVRRGEADELLIANLDRHARTVVASTSERERSVTLDGSSFLQIGTTRTSVS